MEHPPTPELIRFTSEITQENSSRLRMIQILNGASPSENIRRALSVFDFINTTYAEGGSIVVDIDNERQKLLPFRHTEAIQNGVQLTVTMNTPTYAFVLAHSTEEGINPAITINSAITQYAEVCEHELKEEPIFVVNPEDGSVRRFRLM